MQKATYTAKIDGGNTYRDLIQAVPVLERRNGDSENNALLANGHSKVKLSKKNVQLLGYAIDELYYDKEYVRIVELCERVFRHCDVDEKTADSLRRWTKQSRERTS